MAGVAAGWAIAPLPPGIYRQSVVRGTVFALAATIADLDLLVGSHRGPTHSLTAAILVGIVAWVWGVSVQADRPGRRQQRRPLRLALAVSAAYATHTLLDWLGTDSSAPIGIMALWPASRDYYESPVHLFMAISRRYWLPDFWTLNLRAVARELMILGPLALAIVWLRQRKLRAGS